MVRMSAAHPTRATDRRSWHDRLSERILQWSGHRRAHAALFAVAVAEASLLPLPPDILLVSMTLLRPARALWYATLALAGSVIGGLAGYGVGRGLWRLVEPGLAAGLAEPSFAASAFAWVEAAYRDNAFLAVFVAGLAPIPYKLFNVAAGAFEVNPAAFVAASILGRGGRFYLVALLARSLGPRARPFLERRLGWLTIGLVAALLLAAWALGLVGRL
jgi:membrane protein YqaA with SNARE-associated domain